MADKQRQWIGIIAKALMIGGLLLGGYYFWWLKPQLELPRALASAEQTLATHQANLLQNRLALLELVSLTPSSADLESSQATLLSRLNTTREEGEKLLAQEISPPSLKGAPSEHILFVTSELPEALSQLRDQHRIVLKNQKALYEKLSTFHQRVSKLYQYDPAVDLGGLNATTEAQTILARAQAAAEGLGDISGALKTADLPLHERSQLESALRRSQGELTVIMDAAQRGDAARIEAARTSFINQFIQVKGAALAVQQRLISSPDAIANLTQHTNLLLAYNLWLAKINEQQAKIGQ